MRDDHLLSLCMIYLYILIHLVEEPLLVLGLNDDDIFMSQAETKKIFNCEHAKLLQLWKKNFYVRCDKICNRFYQIGIFCN